MKRLVDGFEAAGLKYGDHLNHSDIDNWMGEDKPEFEGNIDDFVKELESYQLKKLGTFERFRDYLLVEKQMYLQSVRGSGYRVVQPSEQTDVALKNGFRQISKGLRQAQRGVDNVNRQLLTTSERERNISVSARLSGLKSMIGRTASYLPGKE